MVSTHTYYVDSSPRISDVWIYSDSTDTSKTMDEWRTILICGLRKGGKQYFALDITDTLNPVFLWEFPRSNDATTLAKVGQSWSEPAIGRVKMEYGGELYERWVAFIGGGQDPNEKKGNDAVMGRGFYVIDVKTGNILWELSKDDSVTYPDTDPRKNMNHAFPSSPTTVDLNADGYVDKVYIGDRGDRCVSMSFNALTKKSNVNGPERYCFRPGAAIKIQYLLFTCRCIDNYQVQGLFRYGGQRRSDRYD
jgi:type IV pilus assembly protein PilY1